MNLIVIWGIAFAAFYFFAAMFILSHKLSVSNPIYHKMSVAAQADWCSRINSTIHGVVVVIGLSIYFWYQRFDNEFMPLRSTELMTAIFSFSIGYFLFDLLVVLFWKVPMWPVFVIHHIVAAIPYIINNFGHGCRRNDYLLSLFLMVELATIPLNITTFIEQLGHGNSKIHSFFFHVTYIVWFFARVLLPAYILFILWSFVAPHAFEEPYCILPALVCGHIIAAFCIGVFIFVWTPDMLARWRSPIDDDDECDEEDLLLRRTRSPLTTPILGNVDSKGQAYGTEV